MKLVSQKEKIEEKKVYGALYIRLYEKEKS